MNYRNNLIREGPAFPPLRIEADQAATAIRESLDKVLDLLSPLGTGRHDHAMIALALDAGEFVEPLSRHEVTVLACALYIDHMGRDFTYADILALTDRFRGKAMNVTMVYKTLAGLIDRRLVDEHGRQVDERTERISGTFAVNESGKLAFRLAILNARQLERMREQKAA